MIENNSELHTRRALEDRIIELERRVNDLDKRTAGSIRLGPSKSPYEPDPQLIKRLVDKDKKGKY